MLSHIIIWIDSENVLNINEIEYTTFDYTIDYYTYIMTMGLFFAIYEIA